MIIEKPIYEVTLKQLRENGACFNGYNKVVRMLQKRDFEISDEGRNSYIRFSHKEYINLLHILENNGLDDAIWCLRVIPGCERDARLFAVWCARQVQHLMTDERSINALNVAESFANGEAAREQLDAASDAAWAAGAATGAAAWAAAWATGAAAWATGATGAAAWATRAAAGAAAARDAQKEMFIKMLKGEASWQL